MILAPSDLQPPSIFMTLFLGWSLDYDYIMTNQVMFTFRRENGYMFNNQTSEQWLWHGHSFGQILLHPKYDFNGEYVTCIVFTICAKFYRLA